MPHLHEITLAFEFLVLTLTVPGLRAKNFKILKCFRVSAPFSFSLTAVFRIISKSKSALAQLGGQKTLPHSGIMIAINVVTREQLDALFLVDRNRESFIKAC
jgi:hypothetical protein